MLNKKQLFSIFVLFLLSITNTFATYSNNTSNGYNDMILDSSLNFEAERDGAMIKMEWDQFDGNNFKYYKIMRSETNSNPIYPNDPYVKYFTNIGTTELNINNYSTKEATYRVCAITTDKNRFCSNTVKLEWFEKDEDQSYNKKIETKTTQYLNKKVNNNALKYSLRIKADIIVRKFIKKIENKYEKDSDRIKAIENIVEKLEKLSETNTKYKLLVDYLVKKLNESIEKYDESFDEIEKIFEWL